MAVQSSAKSGAHGTKRVKV